MSTDGSTIVASVSVVDPWVTVVWGDNLGLLEFNNLSFGGQPGQISSDGSVVVGYNWPNLGRDPPHGLVRWTPQNGVESLNFTPPERQFLDNLQPSSDGTVITGEIRGTITSDEGTQHFREPIRWTDQGGLTHLEGVSWTHLQ